MARTPDRLVRPQWFPNPAKLRAWFAKYALTKDELWILFYKAHTGEPTVTYGEAVKEALSAGWIDGKVKRVDEERYMQRFTPRQPHSYWSSVNVRKAKALIDAGRMSPPGLAAFEGRSKSTARRYSFENRPVDLPREALAHMKRNRPAWEFWKEQPPGYRRVATWFVMSAKREETRARRLAALIAHAAQRRRLPQVISPEQTIRASRKKRVT